MLNFATELTNTSKKRKGYFEVYLKETELDLLYSLIRLDTENLCILFNRLFKKSIESGSAFTHKAELNFNNFVFRGHGCSNWTLTPGVFRGAKNNTTHNNPQDEFNHLLKFLKACDDIQINIPTDTKTLREKLLGENSRSILTKNSWVTSDYHELLGYAQHYGVPTRLLDWSYHPLVALYFSCADLIHSEETNLEDGYFSLWILNIDHLDEVPKVALIDIPKTLNKHISYQKGCFTLVEQFPCEDHPKARSIYTHLSLPIPETVLDIDDAIHSANHPSLLLKINIPKRICRSVFKYCASMNFNASTLYEGHLALSRYIKEVDFI